MAGLEKLVLAALIPQNYHDTAENLITGVFLSLFNGREAKANNKDNYKGITMFSTLCKVYKIILLNSYRSSCKTEWFLF